MRAPGDVLSPVLPGAHTLKTGDIVRLDDKRPLVVGLYMVFYGHVNQNRGLLSGLKNTIGGKMKVTVISPQSPGK
ncbi:MAG TPA: hypothetical protein VN227_08215 [Methanoregula sp.]|nr:hypothetical protein [Methanoregula sp.]